MMTTNAFRIMPHEEEEIIPDKIKLCNSTDRAAYFAIIEDCGYLSIIFVTSNQAGKINVMGDQRREPSDTVD
jgi:hypothetical protein